MTTQSVPVPVPDVSARTAPGLGGFNVTVLKLEVRRLLRNRRTVIFAMITPAVLFLLFGLNKAYANQTAGHGNVSAFIMISMALYGAVLATTSGGAMVSIERSLGWSRQLRITPLSPVAYIAIKILTAMVLGLASVVVVFLVAAGTGKPSMPAYLWVVSALCVWIGSLVFAAFGLFMGYLLPSENVMQILGPVLALLSFAGGLFVPLDQMSDTFAGLAKLTPVYGVGVIARYPLTHDGLLTVAVLNVLFWTVVFAGGAAWRFRRDTARV
jgi:ABC-2 type transport system permease protein